MVVSPAISILLLAYEFARMVGAMNRKSTPFFGDVKAAFWTSEQFEKAVAMDNVGLSAREIGMTIGKSKSAVIGKLNKLRGAKYQNNSAHRVL